jgi:hypothetical protein
MGQRHDSKDARRYFCEEPAFHGKTSPRSADGASRPQKKTARVSP